MKGAANPMIKTVKHRIKSRKTRLMVDVYKTAPYCTVEELDKRNGTSWATNSNFPDQELEFQAEDIKEKSAFIHEVASNEGDVFIDTNGKKVRILPMPNLSTLDDSEGRKLKKRRKGSKFVIEKKKNGRKFNRRKFSKKEISGKEEIVAIKETCKKKDVTITRPPWACSKRTNLAKKRFPVLTKPNEDIRLDDSCEDSSSNMSKERKFSSLNKELLLERREQNEGSKLNLKRKFSALKNSRDHFLSTEDSVIESSNDSLKQKSIIEEDKKKQSMTSKSSSEDSSFGGLEITSESGETDQVQFLSDPVGIEGHFMGLSNSFNDEYYNTFDSRDGIIKNIMIGHNTDRDCMTNIYEQKNYFEDMDLIQIPGPPGSFLPPSPGADTVYEEELQGDSSLTNRSKVQSSDQEYRHDDLMNTDVISDSPMSNVSNPSFARSSDILPAQFTSDLKPVGAIFTEKGLSPSDKIGQPCCCSKKVGSYHQASREEALESYGMNMIKPLADASVKLPVYKDCESASPTSVIRLMGKNLTVVRTDDDPPACSIHMSHQQLHNIPNYDQSSFFYGYLQNSDLRLANCQRLNSNNHHPHLSKSTKEIIVIDDPFEKEAHSDHIFKEQSMPMQQSSHNLSNPYGGGFSSAFQEGSVQTSSTYYPHAFS